MSIAPFLFFSWMMLAGAALSYVKSLAKNTFSINAQTEIRNRILAKLVTLRQQYFDDEGAGALINKLLSDIGQTAGLFSECIPGVLEGAVTVIAVSVYLVTLSARLFLLTIVCYPLLLGLSRALTKRVGQVAEVRRKLYDALGNTAYDAIQGILVGKSFHLYELQKRRIFAIIDDILQNEAVRTKILSVTYVLNNIIGWLPKILCYLFCLYEISKGRLTVGSFLAYVLLLGKMTKAMGEIPSLIVSVKEQSVSVRRLQEIMDAKEEPSGTESFAPTGGTVIEFSHVGFGYASEKEVLRDVSFRVKQGSNIAFVGSSGGGKTTVFKLLCGFYYPQRGSCKIYGHDP